MPINLQLESNAAKSGSCRCNIISQHYYSDLTIKRGMQWATIQCIYVCHESLVQPQTAAGHWLSLCRLLASLRQLVTHDRVSTDRERPRNIAQNIDNLYLISHCSNDTDPANRFGNMKQKADFNFTAVVVVMWEPLSQSTKRFRAKSQICEIHIAQVGLQ